MRERKRRFRNHYCLNRASLVLGIVNADIYNFGPAEAGGWESSFVGSCFCFCRWSSCYETIGAVVRITTSNHQYPIIAAVAVFQISLPAFGGCHQGKTSLKFVFTCFCSFPPKILDYRVGAVKTSSSWLSPLLLLLFSFTSPTHSRCAAVRGTDDSKIRENCVTH